MSTEMPPGFPSPELRDIVHKLNLTLAEVQIGRTEAHKALVELALVITLALNAEFWRGVEYGETKQH